MTSKCSYEHGHYVFGNIIICPERGDMPDRSQLMANLLILGMAGGVKKVCGGIQPGVVLKLPPNVEFNLPEREIVIMTHSEPPDFTDKVYTTGLVRDKQWDYVDASQVIALLRERAPELFSARKFPPQEVIIDDSEEIIDLNKCLS